MCKKKMKYKHTIKDKQTGTLYYLYSKGPTFQLLNSNFVWIESIQVQEQELTKKQKIERDARLIDLFIDQYRYQRSIQKQEQQDLR